MSKPNKKFKISACHTWNGKKIWCEVGRLTMLDEDRGVVRLNMVPDATFQVFALDRDESSGDEPR